jgi:2-dehydropantoate 2-reductase
VNILVVGAGGIGGITAARLALAGHHTTLLVRREAQAAVVRESGIVVFTDQARSVAHPNVEIGIAGTPADLVLIATQPTELDAAIAACAPALHAATWVGCMQNGLGESRIAALLPHHAVLGCVVAFGASVLGEGVYRQTAHGKLTIGEFADPRPAIAQRDLTFLDACTPLQAVAETRITANIAGARWSKLIANCVVSTLGTIAGVKLGELLRHRFARDLAQAVIAEGVEVARAEGIVLEPIAGPFTLATLGASRSGGQIHTTWRTPLQHAALLAFGVKYRNLRSSMLSQIEAGKPPSVRYLNGELVRRGHAHGLGCAVNAELERCVLALAEGRVAPSLATLANVAKRLNLA